MALTTDFATALAFTIGYGVPDNWGQEGGYSDDPDDQGGPTWRGITLANWRSWTGNPDATAAQLKAASEGRIVAFYAAKYWNPVRGDELGPGISLSVFDMAVNAGIYTSVVLLQSTLGFMGTDVDGMIGPKTLKAVEAAAKIDPAGLIDTLSMAQFTSYQTDANWRVFGVGWTNRLNARQAAALTAIGTKFGMQA